MQGDNNRRRRRNREAPGNRDGPGNREGPGNPEGPGNQDRNVLIVVLVIGWVIWRVQSPKLSLANINVLKLSAGTAGSPSFDVTFRASVRIENNNWFPFKYEQTTLLLAYQGIIVEQLVIPHGKVGCLSTEEVPVLFTVSSRALAAPAGERRAGVLSLNGTALMRGKVQILWPEMKKDSMMDCFISFNFATKTVKKLICK